MIRRYYHLVALLCLFPTGLVSQETAGPLDGREGRNLALGHFRPRAMLRVDQHELES